MKIIGKEYVAIRFCDQEYHLAANLEVIEAIQEKYGSVLAALSAAQNAHDLAVIFKLFLDNAAKIYNEDHHKRIEEISLETIMRHGNYNDISAVVIEAITVSMPKTEEDTDKKNGEPGNRRGLVVHNRPSIARLFRARGSARDNPQD